MMMSITAATSAGNALAADEATAGAQGAAVYAIEIDDADRGERLDKALSRHLPEVSRSRLKELILAGHVALEGTPCLDPNTKLKAGDRLSLAIPPAVDAQPMAQDIPLVVVYEDDDLIIIDKPAGLVVHPAAGHADGTLVNALLHHCGNSLSGIGGVRRPGIVHRLDKETSGLMVAAKNDAAHRGLSAQFADHGRSGPLIRAYQAFVWGVPARSHGTISAHLDRSTANREKIAIVGAERGREAITHFTLDRRFKGRRGEDGKTYADIASLVECRLETGRTHQIRVHMASIGHPLLGDAVYGAGFRTKAAQLGSAAQEAVAALGSRQALHAATLGFEHPVTGETMLFESALPPELDRLLRALETSDR